MRIESGTHICLYIKAQIPRINIDDLVFPFIFTQAIPCPSLIVPMILLRLLLELVNICQAHFLPKVENVLVWTSVFILLTINVRILASAKDTREKTRNKT